MWGVKKGEKWNFKGGPPTVGGASTTRPRRHFRAGKKNAPNLGSFEGFVRNFRRFKRFEKKEGGGGHTQTQETKRNRLNSLFPHELKPLKKPKFGMKNPQN